MNQEFKVLTESNLRAPIIQNRFRKLTLQSHNEANIQAKLPQPSECPINKSAIEKFVDPSDAHFSPKQSQMDEVTNKLMLSTPSSNFTEQTNFINVETEPFTCPLQVESTENELPKSPVDNSNNDDLSVQMEKLEVSRVSVDLFSQFTTSSKSSLPPNRVLTNVENIESISQRISNIHMSENNELVDTMPNTSPQRLVGSQISHELAETQPNSSPIVLSDDEDYDDDNDGNNMTNESLLTEDGEENDSIIELSSDDSFKSTDDRIPQDISAINTQTQRLTESAEQKLNHFFDNIPKLDASNSKYFRNADLDNSVKNKSVSSDINVPDTNPSNDDSHDENNLIQLHASQLDEHLEKSSELSIDGNALHVTQYENDQKNQSVDSSSSKVDDMSQHRSLINESSQKSSIDNESKNQSSVQNDSKDMSSSPLHQNNESTDERQTSLHGSTKKNEFEKIKTISKNVITLNSPIINISAKVNINIRLSGFSSSTNSSEADEASDNGNVPSEVSSKNNESISSEAAIDSSRDFKDGCRIEEKRFSGSSLPKLHIDNINHKTTDDSDDPNKRSNEISPESSIIESSIQDGKSNDVIMDSTGSAKDLHVDNTSPTKDTENSVHLDTSAEIDEIGEKLLTDIYGDTWRTPQLVKKCLSARKKCLTDVPKRNFSRGFSLFKRDVVSELESTRITVPEDEENDFKPLDDSPLISSNEHVNEDCTNQSSIIIKRSCRKVVRNRILDYSSDSNQSVGASDADNSFEPVATDSEESDVSWEETVKPKATPRKRNQCVFLDLTCQEVIEDEEHENPDAAAEELEKVSEEYLKSLRTATCVETPAPKKTFTSKRKLFTPNYDDQSPFEEAVQKPNELSSNNNDKIIQLKTPIPSYLIPPQFRDKKLTTIEDITKPITPTTVIPSIKSKKIETPRTPASSKCGFLESLDDKLIPVEHCNAEALKFRSKFKPNRNELVIRLMKLYNDRVFDNKLKNVPVSWNKKLTKTAGYCRSRKIAGVRKCSIELSEKVTTTADRLRDTLIHELCHAATFIIDGEHDGHGKVWKYWAQRANKRFPELPEIKRCHNYDIRYKYTYKCTFCGLKSQSHSKSKKVENIRCSACHGPIEVFLNEFDKDGKVTLVPSKEPSMFAKFVKENYKTVKNPGCSHANVMKILSNNFAALSVQEKTKYKN